MIENQSEELALKIEAIKNKKWTFLNDNIIKTQQRRRCKSFDKENRKNLEVTNRMSPLIQTKTKPIIFILMAVLYLYTKSFLN